MGVFRVVGCLILATVSVCCSSARAEPARAEPSLFDPAKHMRISEVKPGMRGYGLSVFSGTAIERFDVEVISVLKNFNPKSDVVLIRCSGANLEHTGSVAGMSGSPVYLMDEQGHERLIGAFAYGWPLLKDPLAGVQPIEYMLAIPESKQPPTTEPSDGAVITAPPGVGSIPAQRKISWNVLEALRLNQKETTKAQSAPTAPAKLFASGERMQQLATPLMSAGVSAETLDRFAPMLRECGLNPMQVGNGGASNGDREAAPIAPGSVLAAPLLTGDVELTAIGTCTEVIGERVFGFGHPFNGEGPISLPMGSGEISGILPSLNQSQKLGALTKLRGALVADQSVGVAGRLGAIPQTAPIELRVIYTDGSQDVTYRFNCAIHPRLTPVLAGLALSSAMTGRREMPQLSTMDYELSMEFTNGQTIQVRDIGVNSTDDAWDMQNVMFPAQIASENAFERVSLARMSGTIRVTPRALSAEVLSVNIPRLKYKRGETVKAFVTYRPFRAAETVMPIDIELPRDLPDGTYQLIIGDLRRYLYDEKMAQPFRYTAEGVEDVFAILKEISALRHNALYVRLLREPDGVAVGRVALPRLPSSRRQVILSSGRSNTTPFVSSTVKIVPMELLMKGSADFSIEVSSDERVETPGGANKPTRAEPHAPTGNTPGAGEPKTTKPPKVDVPSIDPDKPGDGTGDN